MVKAQALYLEPLSFFSDQQAAPVCDSAYNVVNDFSFSQANFLTGRYGEQQLVIFAAGEDKLFFRILVAPAQLFE